MSDAWAAERLQVDVWVLSAELLLFPTYSTPVIDLPECFSQLCSPIPNSIRQLFKYLNFKYLKVVLCLLPTCYFLRKKIQVPSTTTQETMLPPIWLPFFRTTFIFIHVHTYLIQVDVALRVVPWGSQERCDILGNIWVEACRMRNSTADKEWVMFPRDKIREYHRDGGCIFSWCQRVPCYPPPRMLDLHAIRIISRQI